jgi:GAF domain-containing protein
MTDALVSEADIGKALDHLCAGCVELFGCTAAGILLNPDTGASPLTGASRPDDPLRALLQQQVDSGHGPFLDCIRSGQPIHIADLSINGHRWPTFAALASQHDFDGAHILPMQVRTHILGALCITRARSAELTSDDLALCQSLADTAAGGISQQHAVERNLVHIKQLEGALDSRVHIEQAKGAIATRGKLNPDDAFTLLRGYARANNLPLRNLSKRIVEEPTQIEAILAYQHGRPAGG